jgi:hypothetical protein
MIQGQENPKRNYSKDFLTKWSNLMEFFLFAGANPVCLAVSQSSLIESSPSR